MYHTQSDGLVKRFNRIVLSMLTICVKENPLGWESHNLYGKFAWPITQVFKSQQDIHHSF